MNGKDLIVKWLKKHEICGNKAWRDDKTYYSLNLDQIRDIVNYVNQKKQHQGRRRGMIPTKLNIFDEWQFDCDVPRLLNEIIKCSGAKIYASVWNVFTSLITQVAVRATEIHDPVLDALMLRMGLYDVPASDRRDMVEECEKIYKDGGEE